VQDLHSNVFVQRLKSDCKTIAQHLAKRFERLRLTAHRLQNDDKALAQRLQHDLKVVAQ
jgi:hypothetical protein